MTKIRIGKDEEKQIVIDSSGEYVIELVGEGAAVEVLGAFKLKGKQKLDLMIEVIHKAKHTKADTFIRAVVGGETEAKIRGRIKVLKGAGQTDSFLRENILLVSKKAKAEAVPDLEIEVDEVKASHAATVGKIDKEQLFYLMSRGLSRVVAEQMIVDGFLDAVRKRINF